MAKAQELRLARSSRAYMLLALLAGLIAAILVFLAVSNARDDSNTSAPSLVTVPVVVASTDISPGTAITAEMLRVADVPENLVVAGAFLDATPLVGQVTNVGVAAGEQVIPSKLGPVVEGEGLPYILAPGMRAVGLSVDSADAAGGLLLPGDRVDVMAAFSNAEDTGTTVATLLQNVEILAIGEQALEAIAVAQPPAEGAEPEVSGDGRVPDDAEADPDAGTVTLSLTPEQSQVLFGLRQQAESVWLIARAASDHDTPEIPRTNVDSSGTVN